MAYQLSIDTGKRGSRRVTRQASPRDISSLVADDGNTRVEVELHASGAICITVLRDDTHERRALVIPGMRPDMTPNMPTLIVIHPSGTIDKQGQHVIDQLSYHDPELDAEAKLVAQHIRARQLNPGEKLLLDTNAPID